MWVFASPWQEDLLQTTTWLQELEVLHQSLKEVYALPLGKRQN